MQLKSCHTLSNLAYCCHMHVIFHFLQQVQINSKWSMHVYCILLASFRLETSQLTCAYNYTLYIISIYVMHVHYYA